MVRLDSVVRAAAGLVSRKTGGELLIVSPQGGNYIVLNETGAQLWDLADGQRTLSDLAQTMAQAWGLEPDRTRQDVLCLATDLVERGVLVIVGPQVDLP